MAQELNVWKRLKGQTPLFFKRVQIVASALVALCSSLQIIPHLSERLVNLSINGIVAGSVAILVAKFALESGKSIEDEPKEA